MSITGNHLAFLAGSGETNTVTVSETSGIITVRDTSSSINAGPGVTVVNANEVTVPAAGVFQISVSTLDLDDTVDASGLTPASGLGRTIIQGGTGNDTLVGSGLDDFFIESSGNDSVDGGALGTDQWTFNSDLPITLTDTTLSDGVDVDTYSGIEAVNLGGFLADNVIDASAVTAASGIRGVNMTGREGNDTLIAGGVRGIFRDFLGTNTFVGGPASDAIVAVGDVDITLTDTSITVGTSVSTFTSVDAIDLNGGGSDNVINASAVTASSGFTSLRIFGNGGDDTITGSPLNDTIFDSVGANILDGGGGTDLLVTSIDQDQFLTNTTLTISGDVSTHTNFERISLQGGNSANLLDATALDASSGVELVNFQGLDGDDTLLGSQVVDEIRSRGGNNTIDGGSSPTGTRDRVVFFQDLDMTASDASVIVGTGVNTLTNVEQLALAGSASDNTLDGSALTIASGIEFLSLLGIGGDDTILPSGDSAISSIVDGGAGNDTLDLSARLATPGINTIAPGNVDGDRGNVDTDVTFNNINSFVLPSEYDFTATNFSDVEGNADSTTSVVEVTRSVNTTISSSVNVMLTAGTATAGDFTAGPITVNFLPGEVTKSVPVELLGDRIVELNETIALSLVDGISGATHPTAELTITNDDSATISIGDVSQLETDSGQTAFEFDVSLSAPVDVAVNLQANTADDSATVTDGDYDALSANVVSFAASTVAGSHTETVTVLVNGDTNSEVDESFFVNLTALLADGRDVTFADSQGLGTISNDDVSNLPPELLSADTDATFATKAEPGDTVLLSATFSDPNVNDTHAATIEWGDGTTSTGTVNQSTGEVTADHVYSTGGIFDVLITIDDGTATDTVVTTAVVSGMRLTDNGTLQIIGTDANDSIHVKRQHGNIRVRAKAGHGPQDTQFFALNDVALLVIHTCDGRDNIRIHHNVNLPTVIDSGADRDHVIGGSGDDLIRGGSGNDLIWGGDGNDVLLGEAGHDRLFGNWGRDIIVGGTGNDVAFGGGGQDLLIGGSTIHDSDHVTLNAIRDEWTSNKSQAVRRQNLLDGTGDNAGLNGTAFLDSSSLIDDNEFDWLVGGWGNDWFPTY